MKSLSWLENQTCAKWKLLQNSETLTWFCLARGRTGKTLRARGGAGHLRVHKNSVYVFERQEVERRERKIFHSSNGRNSHVWSMMNPRKQKLHPSHPHDVRGPSTACFSSQISRKLGKKAKQFALPDRMSRGLTPYHGTSPSLTIPKGDSGRSLYNRDGRPLLTTPLH